MSEKPEAHAVQTPPVAPEVQVAQLLAQNAHVPAKMVGSSTEAIEVAIRKAK